MEKEEEPKINVQNKKGFTLVELLAVIAIIAVLIIVAIPAVTNTISSSRKSTYAANAKRFIDTVRLGLTKRDLKKSSSETCQFPKPGHYIVVDLSTVYVEKGGEKSSFNQDYYKHYVIVANEGTVSSGDKIVYYYAGSDKGKNGIENFTKEDEITKSKIKVGNTKTNYTSTLNSFNGYQKDGICYGNKNEDYVPNNEPDNKETPPEEEVNTGNFVAAYNYGSSCKTGEEANCKYNSTNCYKLTGGTCPIGTIIKYKVNESEQVLFNVLLDNGTTIKMQSISNTVSNVRWYGKPGSNPRDDSAYTSDNTLGPIEAIQRLEGATSTWTNVNNQTYAMGDTSFSDISPATGCSSKGQCSYYTYTWPSKTAKARMITMQEALDLGCKFTGGSCPEWMRAKKETYWTMTAFPTGTKSAWSILDGNLLRYLETKEGSSYGVGARAVVEVNKQ